MPVLLSLEAGGTSYADCEEVGIRNSPWSLAAEARLWKDRLLGTIPLLELEGSSLPGILMSQSLLTSLLLILS